MRSTEIEVNTVIVWLASGTDTIMTVPKPTSLTITGEEWS